MAAIGRGKAFLVSQRRRARLAAGAPTWSASPCGPWGQATPAAPRHTR